MRRIEEHRRVDKCLSRAPVEVLKRYGGPRKTSFYSVTSEKADLYPIVLKGRMDFGLCQNDEILEFFEVPYEKWKDIVRLSGPAGLRAIKGFHDEALSGQWEGNRASRLGRQWRVIYRVAAETVLIQVVTVNAHDYRRS